MTWPQIVVALSLIFCVVHGVVVVARSKTAGWPTVTILIHVAIYVVFALVLSAGGFW